MNAHALQAQRPVSRVRAAWRAAPVAGAVPSVVRRVSLRELRAGSARVVPAAAEAASDALRYDLTPVRVP
jgi:hypothetical protein